MRNILLRINFKNNLPHFCLFSIVVVEACYRLVFMPPLNRLLIVGVNTPFVIIISNVLL